MDKLHICTATSYKIFKMYYFRNQAIFIGNKNIIVNSNDNQIIDCV